MRTELWGFPKAHPPSKYNIQSGSKAQLCCTAFTLEDDKYKPAEIWKN